MIIVRTSLLGSTYYSMYYVTLVRTIVRSAFHSMYYSTPVYYSTEMNCSASYKTLNSLIKKVKLL